MPKIIINFNSTKNSVSSWFRSGNVLQEGNLIIDIGVQKKKNANSFLNRNIYESVTHKLVHAFTYSALFDNVEKSSANTNIDICMKPKNKFVETLTDSYILLVNKVKNSITK